MSGAQERPDWESHRAVRSGVWRRHDEALIQAEIRRLVRAFGGSHEDARKRASNPGRSRKLPRPWQAGYRSPPHEQGPRQRVD